MKARSKPGVKSGGVRIRKPEIGAGGSIDCVEKSEEPERDRKRSRRETRLGTKSNKGW